MRTTRQPTSDCIRRFNVIFLVILPVLLPISAWSDVNRIGSECARSRSHDGGASLSTAIFHSLWARPHRDLAAPPIRRSTTAAIDRRSGLLRIARSSVIAPLVVQVTARSSRPALAYTPDADPLRESLYLMSRVQEATVQQERFVDRATRQEALKSKMKLTLRLVERNYRVLDQVTFASQFVVPSSGLVEATTAGYEAADALQNAIDYVNTDGVGGLGMGPFEVGQKDYLRRNLRECRERLFDFLSYMPRDKLEEARKRVEEGACA
jgi:hypothetical protein